MSRNDLRRRFYDISVVALLLAAVALIALGVFRLETNTEDALSWLPDDSPARESFEVFHNQFGIDDFVVITWDGCTSEDGRLSSLASRLREFDSTGLLERVTIGPEVRDHLVFEIGLSAAQAYRRLRGIFFGVTEPDLTCAVVELSDRGTKDRRSAMEYIQRSVDAIDGLAWDEVSVGGYPYLARHFDAQIKQSFQRSVIPSVVLATIVAMLCLRDFGLTLITFACAALAAGLSVALIPLFGHKMGGLDTIIPTLTFVLTASGCLHLIRYSLPQVGDVRYLLRQGWRPCTVSTVTTAIGMASLARSGFPAIREFGVFCAAGVLVSLLLQLVVVPWMLWRFGQPGLRRMAGRTSVQRRWGAWLNGVVQLRWPVAIIAAFAFGLGIVGLTRLSASVEIDGLFSPRSPVLENLARMERQLGPLDQAEVMVTFPSSDADGFERRFRWVRAMQARWIHVPPVRVSHSLVNYLPDPPGGRDGRSLVQQSVFRRKLLTAREELAKGPFLRVTDSEEIWRVSLRVPFADRVDFDRLKRDVLAVASEVNEQYAGGATDQHPAVDVTGMTFLFHHAQNHLLQDLFWNFLMAFALITPLLVIVLRSIPLGLVSMIPNLLPTVWAFGAMGMMGLPVDLAIAMTASVALGIAVDDTSHLVIRFRERGGSLRKIWPALNDAMRDCGPAMFYTTAIGISGIMASWFIQLYVIARFSAMISALLGLALIADIALLPALLAIIGSANIDRAGESKDPA